MRLYLRAHRQRFGEQMLQTFCDHYRDAVEMCGESEARYWLSVAGDESKSVVREHLAALVERFWPMRTILAAPLGVWRGRQTRRLALVTQLCLIAAVLLVWTPLLVGRALLPVGEHGLMNTHAGTVSYAMSASAKQPTALFITTFTQATDDIAAHELHPYQFSASRVEISTLPFALAEANSNAHLPAILLDGEPTARIPHDLRVVAGRLPEPAASVLEVVVTRATANQLHLTLNATLPITTLPGQHAPQVRVVGIVETTGTAFPTDRVAFDPANQDAVWYWAQTNPLDYVLTTTEAIGAYSSVYDWNQLATVEPFFSQTSGPNPVPPSENPPLWQAWWIGTTDYSDMDAQHLSAFLSYTAPDPSPRLNQMLGVSPLVEQADFSAGGTWAGFYQGHDDYTDADLKNTLAFWFFAVIVAGLLVLFLSPVTQWLAERQQALLAVLRDHNPGTGRRRVLGTCVAQALTLVGFALLVGGLLVLPVARAVAAMLLPIPARSVVDTLIGGPLDTHFSVAGGVAMVLLALAAPLVMLREMRGATRRATTPPPESASAPS